MGVDQRIVHWLQQNGHDAIHLRDQGLQRLPDPDIFEKNVFSRLYISPTHSKKAPSWLSKNRAAGYAIYQSVSSDYVATVAPRIFNKTPVVREVGKPEM